MLMFIRFLIHAIKLLDFTLDLQWNLQLLERLLFASTFEDISLVRRKLVTLFNR
ncbi:hypothetical protein DPMN_054712 [Dreissena polymorpha]|uniref:Uncharacterized protein n=1 Tax=Dreissena polymorpha TaxID=45954 RepID=A0A9D4CR97_DREPO|nr:hypothetical protein DPMN_054712 [Dreissena polymorpha]